MTKWSPPQWNAGTQPVPPEKKVIPFESDTRVQGAEAMEYRQGHILRIQHIPTGYTLTMPAFLDSFSDAYSSEWSEQTAYGRMDSAGTFAGTKRNISIAWNLPAESFDHAAENLLKINTLINFLYPLYDAPSKDKDPVLNMDPILRLSFGNLVRDAKTGRGLLGYVNGITFDPVLEEGLFHGKPTAKGSPVGSSRTAIRVGQGQRTQARNLSAGGNPQNNQYYPKTVRLNVEFKVLHEHSLGFSISKDTTSDLVYAGRTRASYTFNEPSLNFSNFPNMTNSGGNRATRGSWTGETLLRQPTRSNLIKDPGSPQVVMEQSAVQQSADLETPATPAARQTRTYTQGFGPGGEASGAGSPPRGARSEAVYRVGGSMEAL
jgi:hypothetical protein